MGVLEQTIPYTYATSGWKDRLTSYNGESIVYDALGNPTSYRGHTLVWGRVKQLQAYDTNSFTYNAEGIRTSKNDITYELDGTKIIREVRPNGTIEYYYGNNGIAGFTYNGTQYYYQKNLQGDVVAIFTTSGTKVAEYVYDTWGKCTVVLDTNGIGTLNSFRYRRYYFDTETGLYYLQSRYYDPEVGRFINADNLVSTGQGILGHNMFAYCLNSPVSRKDVSGSISRALKDDYDLIDWLLDYGPIDGGHLYTSGGAAHGQLVGSRTKQAFSKGFAIGTGLGFLLSYLFGEVSTPVLSVEKGLIDIGRKYKTGECDKATRAMEKYLKKHNKNYKVIVLFFPGAYHGLIVSDKNPNEAIGDNYFHCGVLYNGIVYCNVYPEGLEKDVWINSFWAEGIKIVYEFDTFADFKK